MQKLQPGCVNICSGSDNSMESHSIPLSTFFLEEKFDGTAAKKAASLMFLLFHKLCRFVFITCIDMYTYLSWGKSSFVTSAWMKVALLWWPLSFLFFSTKLSIKSTAVTWAAMASRRLVKRLQRHRTVSHRTCQLQLIWAHSCNGFEFFLLCVKGNILKEIMNKNDSKNISSAHPIPAPSSSTLYPARGGSMERISGSSCSVSCLARESSIISSTVAALECSFQNSVMLQRTVEGAEENGTKACVKTQNTPETF